MTKVIDQVEDLLVNGYKTASPQRLRDSNKALVLAFWERQGLYLDEDQKRAYMRCKSAGSITRARREFNKTYPPSPKVVELRYERFKEYKYDQAVML